LYVLNIIVVDLARPF